MSLNLATENFAGIILVATRRSADALEKLKDRINKLHKDLPVRIELADLGRQDEVSKLLHNIKSVHVSCLVNNAGFGLNGRVDKLDLQRQLDMVSLNCSALLHLSQVLVARHTEKKIDTSVPSMLVINVGSLSGLVPALPWQSVYAATKVFVSSLSRSCAFEWRSAGIRVLLVEPGSIADTNFQAASGQPFHKGHLTTDDLVQVVSRNLRYLDYQAFEIIPTLQDRITAALTQNLPSSLILPILAARGKKYTPKELI
jgi:uncharacterized protein